MLCIFPIIWNSVIISCFVIFGILFVSRFFAILPAVLPLSLKPPSTTFLPHQSFVFLKHFQCIITITVYKLTACLASVGSRLSIILQDHLHTFLQALVRLLQIPAVCCRSLTIIFLTSPMPDFPSCFANTAASTYHVCLLTMSGFNPIFTFRCLRFISIGLLPSFNLSVY